VEIYHLPGFDLGAGGCEGVAYTHIAEIIIVDISIRLEDPIGHN
jgi:hypothetical protein